MYAYYQVCSGIKGNYIKIYKSVVAPRGVTDLYFSWGIHVEHVRTAYQETCRTEYQQAYRRCNSQITIFQLEHSTGAPNQRVWRITQLAKLSSNHPSVVLTADLFQYFYKNYVFFNTEFCGEFGWVRFLVVCFLYKTNPNPRKTRLLWEKSGPNVNFNLIFSWVGELDGFMKIFIRFPTQQNLLYIANTASLFCEIN